MEGHVDVKVIEEKLKKAIADREAGKLALQKSEKMISDLRAKEAEIYVMLYQLDGTIEAYETLLGTPEQTKEQPNG